MKILRLVIIGLILLVAVLAVVGLLLPDTVRVERSITINASPDSIFPKVNSVAVFREWSPWYQRDPDMEVSYSGPDSGVGAAVEWSSNQSDVGSGRQIITESREYEYVGYDLDFGAQGKAQAWFEFEPSANSTTEQPMTDVTWGFTTDFGYDLIGRYFGLVLESMLAPDYEEGLKGLKTVVEKG
ncbi:MAG: hypothetical protein DHS20C01_07380 [marine bacterium B5-7]|nr:MAG: hypothetical protein DHS20C01_07380 [marine bacterium B5-7]